MRLINLIIILLVIFSGIFFLTYTKTITGRVARVIDGDTIDLENHMRIRLMGINTPEKNMPFHDEAQKFVESKIKGKKVKVELRGRGKYGRFLGYVFVDGENLNQKILEKGLANLYFYSRDARYKDLKKAQEKARLQNKGIWKKSPNTNCLKLLAFNYKESKKCSNQENMILSNSCPKTLKLIIKDNANHIFREAINPNSLLIKNFSCVFNDDGDSLFIWDEKGLLIYQNY